MQRVKNKQQSLPQNNIKTNKNCRKQNNNDRVSYASSEQRNKNNNMNGFNRFCTPDKQTFHRYNTKLINQLTTKVRKNECTRFAN